MSLVRTLLERTVQRSIKNPKRSYSTTKRRSHTLTTSPKRRRRPSKPSGKMLSHMVLTADKVVALVVMDKSQYVDKCMALLHDTKVCKPFKDTTKKLQRDIQETLRQLNREHDLPDYIGGANATATNCSPQVTHPQHLDSMVYLKFIKLIAPCDP